MTSSGDPVGPAPEQSVASGAAPETGASPEASEAATQPLPVQVAGASSGPGVGTNAGPTGSPIGSNMPSPVGSAATGSASSEPPPGKPAHVTMGDPKFEGGEVPKAKAALDRLTKAFTKCVNEHGGLHGAKGTIEVQFLVRAQGIAEGVDVQDARGIDPEAKKCVRDALKKKTMGPPSADPVGVTVKIELEPSSSPATP